MRTFTLIFSLLVALGCRTNKPVSYVQDHPEFEIVEHSFKGESYVDTSCFTNGNIEAISTYAFSKSGVRTDMFSGERQVFYEDGTLKSVGFYDISYYLNCCFAGPCEMEYYYKIGEWVYYHRNGQIQAKGTYDNDLHHIETSCEGGDYFMMHRTTELWAFYDELGNKVAPTNELINELETSIFNNLVSPTRE